MTENSIYQVFWKQAQKTGDSPAFFAGDETVSFAQFLSQVDALASGLNGYAVEPGDRVCIMALNSVPFLALVVACAKIGAVAYPINWRLAQEEAQEVISLAESKVLVAEENFLPQLESTDLSAIPALFLMGTGQAENFAPFESLFGTEDAPTFDGDPEQTVTIISTAAVGGAPRGAELSHKNYIALGEQFKQTYNLTDGACFLSALPYFHIAGLGITLAFSMIGGASVVLPEFDADACVQMMDRHQVSMIATFPPMLEMLIKSKETQGATWESLRYCFGILNPLDVIQSYLALGCGEYWTGYGQTETTGITTLINVMEKPGSAGKVVDALEMRIVNDADEDMPAGEPGEIIARGDLIFNGYWRDDEYTTFTGRNGWHHTGDLGKVDEEGYLYFVGRKPEKELIKSGGENIYPAEVEKVIAELAEVAAVCVLGVPDEKWGETVKAVVELAAGKTLDEDDLLAEIKGKLAAYKRPRLIEFVEKLPRLENGEIDREAVKAS